MKVILTQDVKGVGRAGDLVDVSDGYGRNYLVPRGLAVAATGGNVKAIEHEQAVLRQKLDKERAEAQRLAEKLHTASVTVRVKAGESGRLFGSVTAGDIAQALAEQFGVQVDRRRIELEAPLKSLGTYPVTLRLAPGITAEVQLVVEAEQAAGAGGRGS
ncbi:MAG: 50S ribosomal protein L9 [Bacillota bacterium]